RYFLVSAIRVHDIQNVPEKLIAVDAVKGYSGCVRRPGWKVGIAGLSDSRWITSVGVHRKNFVVAAAGTAHVCDPGAIRRPLRTPRATILESQLRPVSTIRIHRVNLILAAFIRDKSDPAIGH